MNYLTTAEFAQKWNISQRRVSLYCKTGRILGAEYKGNMWLIPEDAKKPEDPRRVRNKEQEKISNTYLQKVNMVAEDGVPYGED